MGGAVSIAHADVIVVADDDAIGLTGAYAARYTPFMPAPFNLSRPVVTRAHEKLIKANWAAVCQGTPAFDATKHLTPTKFFFTTFYQTLFTTEPTLRSLFRSGMTVQGKALTGVMHTLAMLVNSNTLVDSALAIAERHLAYGVSKDHYGVFGTALLATLEAVSGSQWSTAVHEAYLTAYALVFYIMMPVLLTGDALPIPESIPATIMKSVAISHATKRISLAFDFPLRFHPGDAVWLGFTTSQGYVRRHFTITTISIQSTTAIDICVADVGGDASQWLCAQVPGAVVDLFWVESDLRFEIDAPDVLPAHVVFVGHGIGCIPFITMLEGLYTIRDVWKGSVVSLQCAASIEDVQALNAGVPSTGEPITWDTSTIYYAATVTAFKLKDIAPNLASATLFVCGPDEFVTTTLAAWATAGGAKNRMNVFSFDNNKPFPLGAASLKAIRRANEASATNT
ncbi:Aste57867_23404 [Aphanomyces stellatus]|uniref:nitric oxide dioxygenase n=1 Tax=Aphanomyces stellatus TaxID=120398 RepID=A0A485LPG9_9STRA|nr:hypothetical protein As57867_023333 [Aphanomyces stellatus]VFU00050.1 Aste57867_23404 [Aphanomyces stellatus]